MKKIHKTLGIVAFFFLLSTTTANAQSEETQAACYQNSVNEVNNMEGFYNLHPNMQHAIAGAIYDACIKGSKNQLAIKED